MEKNKKNYYYKNNKKNYYRKNNKNKEKVNDNKKVTYDSLMHTKVVTYYDGKDDDINKTLIIKYIAITVVLFAIIIGSLILFSKV